MIGRNTLALAIAALLLLLPASMPSLASDDIAYYANPPRAFVSATLPSQSSNLCQISRSPPQFLHCYTPQVIQRAYNFTGAYELVGGYSNAGQGQAIVIIDAFGSPTIAHDLEVFDQTFGLPPANLVIVCPQGCPTFNPRSANEVGWSFETTLDVEYAHAMAPAATIILVIAATNFGNAINNAEKYALTHQLGYVWSQSFGAPECVIRGNNLQIKQAEQTYQQAVQQGITLIASSGDTGAQEGCPFPSAIFPSSDPLNLAVGGTHLNVTNNGDYQSETVWNDEEDAFLLNQRLFFPYATGGAPSLVFPLPSYQAGLTYTTFTCSGSSLSTCSVGATSPLTMRTTSDVAYNGDIDGGVIVYWSAIPEQKGYYIVGGTSAGSPQWAAIIAIANQLHGSPLGDIHSKLYSLAGTKAFHDITQGSNTLRPGTGFIATVGYDPPTGLGSPNVGYLVAALAQGS